MIYRTFTALYIALVASVFLSTAPAYAQGQEETLMTIGNTPVHKSEFIYLMNKGDKSELGALGMSREEYEENLELFINFKLKVLESEALGLDKTMEFVREYEAFKENLKAPFLIRNSLEEGEVRKAYSRMQQIVRASHILLEFPPDASKDDSLSVLKMALKLKKQIESGESINDLAVKHSDDPSAAINRGDLGYFTGLQMIQPFEDAAYTLEIGKVSDPVLTEFGYHIIQVENKMPNPGQVHVSHILVRINNELENGEDIAKRKVADIYTEIQRESTVWEDIVKDYSEDPATNFKGGLLPWFGVGSMIPDFEIAAFSLTEIGEVSPPIKTRYGFHILRLEGKRELQSFESLEQNIRSRILRDSRSSMISSQVMAIQKSRYSFKENEENIASLENQLNALSQREVISKLSSQELGNMFLFSLKDANYSANDLAKFIGESEIQYSGPKNGIFNYWYTKFSAELLNKAEDADLTANNKDYQMLLKEYHDGILLFSLMNEQVWQKGLNDSVAQRRFYTNNIKKYQWKKRADAYIVKVLDMTQLDKARKMLQNKDLTPELIDSFEQDFKVNSPLAFHTESGVIEIPDHAVLAQANLKQSYQELELNGHLYMVLLGEIFSAEPKKFDEIKGLVIRDYQEYLDKSLLERLKNKYPVKINPKAKEEAFVSVNQ